MNSQASQFFFAATLIVGLAACDNSDQSDSENNAQDSTEEISVLFRTREKSCLEDYQAEPWSLFSLDEIAKFANLSASEGTMAEPMKVKNLAHRAAGYKWDSDRTLTVKVGEREVSVSESDKVTLGRFTILDAEKIKGSYVEHFKNQYKKLTAEEQAQFDQAFARQLENESDLTKGIGKGFAGLSNQIDYKNIDGIGQAANWETNPRSSDGLLHVLHKNMTFVVVVNLSDDSDYNLEVAKKIAAATIEKCDS